MGGFDVRDAARAMRRDSWVRPHLRTHWKMLAAAVLLSSLAFVFASALMFTSGYMISLAATIPFTVLALHLPSIFVRIFGVGKPVLQYLERLASHDWVLRMTSSLRVRLYDAVERRPAGSSTGRMLGLFADDLENLQNLCLRTLFPMIVVAAMYAIVVVAFGVLSPLMGLAMLAVVGLAAFAVPFWSFPSTRPARPAGARRFQACTTRPPKTCSASWTGGFPDAGRNSWKGFPRLTRPPMPKLGRATASNAGCRCCGRRYTAWLS